MKRFLCLALVALMVASTACKRTTIIPDDELALIFRDAFLTNAYIDSRHINIDSLNVYEPLFARHGYTMEDVQTTIGTFSKRKSARLSDVVEQAIDLLEEEGLYYDREVTILDTIKQIAIRNTRRVIREDSLIEVRSLADTARLSFVMHDLLPGEYRLQYTYKIDSADRNKRLQRKVWIEREDSTRVGYQIYTLRRYTDDKVDRVFRTDSLAERLRIHLLIFPDNEEPKRPSITVRDLRITYTPNEEDALRLLHDKQMNLRIFADEFLDAALKKDSL